MIKFWEWTKKLFFATIKSVYYITLGWLVLIAKVITTNIKKWLKGNKK